MVKVSQAPSASSSSSSSSGEPALETVQENVYDGRGYRIIRKTYAAGILYETRHAYFTASWRDIEERLGSSPDSAEAERQFIWGNRYIDDLILRDREASEPADDVLNERLYALQDVNWSVVTGTDSQGEVQERYEYEAYGGLQLLRSNFDPAVASPNGIIRFAGCEFDYSTSLFFARYRPLHARGGIWLRRDIADYIDGQNLYQYCRGNPVRFADPLGLQATQLASGQVTPRAGTFTIVGPKATIVSFVAHDTNPEIDEAKLHDAWIKAKGTTLRETNAHVMNLAFIALNETANPSPPPTFVKGPAGAVPWEDFVSSKEFRGYLYLKPRICCDQNNRIMNWGTLEEGSSQGYTPPKLKFGTKVPTISYQPGEGSSQLLPTVITAFGCVAFSYTNEFRIGKKGQDVWNSISGNAGVPYAWEKIEYLICCNGLYQIRYYGSYFPSHDMYLDGVKFASRKQTGLFLFSFTADKTRAPGGELTTPLRGGFGAIPQTPGSF